MKAKQCKYCHAPVKEISGKVLMKGNAPTYRHVNPPVGCEKGDPLLEADAE